MARGEHLYIVKYNFYLCKMFYEKTKQKKKYYANDIYIKDREGSHFHGFELLLNFIFSSLFLVFFIFLHFVMKFIVFLYFHKLKMRKFVEINQ